MSWVRIELDGERNVFRPGQTITGDAAWSLTRAPDTVELCLFWYTRGKGDRDVEVVDRIALPASGMSGSTAFRFNLPAEPYSFSGRLISLIWALELVVQPGQHTDRVEFVLSPTGREVVVHAAEPTPAAGNG